jgi:hypothetical protein
VLGLTAACAEPMSSPAVIESIRPLAIRAEVVDPEAVPDAPVRCEALPFETVRLEPFIVDENGPLAADAVAELDPVWVACNMLPAQYLGGCYQEAGPFSLDEIEDCRAPDPADLDPEAAGLPTSPSPCRMTGGTPERPELVVPIDPSYLLGGDLEITMVASEPEGDTAACAEALFGQADDILDGCLFAVQRVQVGPDALLVELARELLGIDFGDDVGPTPDEIPDPDTNPRLVRFEVEIVDGGDVLARLDVGRGSAFELEYGQLVMVRAEASGEDLQTYPIPEDDDTFQEEREYYTGRWYRTWGEFLAESSDDPVGRNEWTMVPGEQDDGESALDDHAVLYYVLRDDRGGVDWWWFSVELTGELP